MGHGGARPGAGRPTGSRDKVKAAIEAKGFEDCVETVHKIAGLLEAWIFDEGKPDRFRFDCMQMMTDRVLGKATQHTSTSGVDKLEVTLIGGINAVDEEPGAE